MKFTPETLLQIYLDGSFTEEAQAEFDALMRKDPVFAEKVTQAVAERLGPVPESTVNALSASLDSKIGDVWNRHKPSLLGHYLKLGFKIAAVLAAAGCLFLAGRYLKARLYQTAATSAVTLASKDISKIKPVEGQVQMTKPNGAVPQKTTNLSTQEKPVASKGKTKVGVNPPADHPMKNNSTSNPAASGKNPSVSSSNPTSGTLPSSTGPSSLPLNATGSSATAEGNSLRVAIDMDKTQNVTVTVFDANGLLVRHLFNGVLEVGEHNVDWDGRDELGNNVLPGDYTVILEMGGKKMSGVLKVLPSQ